MTRRAVLRQAAHGIARRKRALVLLLLGATFALTGYVQLDTGGQTARLPMARLTYVAHLRVMPLTSWGWVFITVGLFAAVSGFIGRVPAWLGFAALQALTLGWSLLFVASWMETGYGRTWIGAIQWAMIAGLLFIIADWEDPPLRTIVDLHQQERRRL